VKKKRSKKKTM